MQLLLYIRLINNIINALLFRFLQSFCIHIAHKIISAHVEVHIRMYIGYVAYKVSVLYGHTSIVCPLSLETC